jgi:hypothetical protein
MARKKCEQCGAAITPGDKKGRPRRFCGIPCANRYISRRRATTKGWTVTTKGYVMDLRPGHPNARGGYVMRHRLVMEEMLGRLLTANEIVHHKDENKANNARENLELLTTTAHNHLPKPKRKPIKCPHCGGMIALSGRARTAKPI